MDARGKLNIFCIADYFIPGFLGGGPITTLVNMRKQLNAHINLSVFTRDRDLGSNEKYPGIEINQWSDGPGGPIYYASPEEFGVRGIFRALECKKFEIIYFNSFFSSSASIFPLLALRAKKYKLPILLAPRGEFSSGALAKKSKKKRIYLAISKYIGLYEDIFWHASTQLEADDIQRIFPEAAGRIFVAADPIFPLSNKFASFVSNKKVGTLRMVFLSRISPMKNLDGLINILATVTCPIKLDIFGPIEDESYWRHCKELISNLPQNIEVEVHGPITPDSVTSTFSRYDLFAFPTHGENFGHVIFESLCAGTPVLVSDQTPWHQDDAGALTVIPLRNFAGWREAIVNAANRLDDDYIKMRNAALKYANLYADEANTNNCNSEMFLEVLRRSS